MKKMILLSFLFLLALTFAACGDKGDATADTGAEKDALDGDFTAFAPEGDVYAVIDGEEFIYDPIYLSFHDYVGYPEDPATPLLDILSQNYKDWSYGDYALFRELLNRAAHDAGFSVSDEEMAATKKSYEELLCGGVDQMYLKSDDALSAEETETEMNEDEKEVYAMIDNLSANVEAAKEKYGVKDEKALAELTWPVTMQGYYGGLYSVRYHTENFGGDVFDNEAEQEFWQTFYEELQAKYHCTLAN